MKKLMRFMGLVVGGMLFLSMTGCGSGSSDGGNSATTQTTTESSAKVDENKVYGIGEEWIVDGQWKMVINSVTASDERNQFSDKNPAQVIVVNYTYENLGYESSIQDLFISGMSMKVIDSARHMGSTYPITLENSATPTPVGAICAGAEEGFGLDNESTEVTINVEQYDGNYKTQKASFQVPVQ